MEDSVRNEETEAKKVGDGDVRKTYEKPSLMEYGSIEKLTKGSGSGAIYSNGTKAKFP